MTSFQVFCFSSFFFFPWLKRVIFYFILLPMSCCLNGNNITDMRDGLLWWIAWAAEPVWGEYQQPTLREKTNRTRTSRWLGYTSIRNVCQTPNRSSRGSFCRHILCIVWCLFKDSPHLFPSEARLQKNIASSYMGDLAHGFWFNLAIGVYWQ